MKTTNDIEVGATRTSLPWLLSAALALGLAASPARAQILIQPQSQTVPASFTAFFAVGTTTNVTGYQWYFDGSNIAGATAPILNVINARQTNAGTYYVQVSGSFGSALSSNVTLTVTNLPFLAPSMQFTTLASLGRFIDGAAPQAGVIQGRDGCLYGATSVGGTNNAPSSTNGAVFKMSTTAL